MRLRAREIIPSCLLMTLLAMPSSVPAAECENKGGKLQLDCPAPPNTDLAAQPDFDIFAWNTFIALNWPALPPDKNNGQRGFPDLGTSFAEAAPTSTTVWETFKEKREVFNHPKDLPPWNGPINYGPLRFSNGHQDPDQTHPASRGFLQLSKTSFDSLDETVQVASEARETHLPNGAPNPVLGRKVGPRVWKAFPKDGNPVLYEVKVNYDFFQYVKDNGFYKYDLETKEQEPLASRAAEGAVRLPYRTSALAGPRQQQAYPGAEIKTGYSSRAALEVYKTVTPKSEVLPPLIGAVHLKAAWIRLTAAEIKSGRYHTAEAYYYADEGGLPVRKEDTFGLVGLHIIQRIHLGSPGKSLGADGKKLDNAAEARGGTFIFATWEHVDNDLNVFTYSNYYDPKLNQENPAFGPDGKPLAAQFVPGLDDPYVVTRRFQPISQHRPGPPGTQQVNERVHGAIRRANADSVWLNYRLIGTQFQAINVDDRPLKPRYPVTEYDPTGIGQPLYLANLLVETNDGLQKFQGLPPGTQPVEHYRGVGIQPDGGKFYNRDAKNLSFGRLPFNFGGCMGCHGVAQISGYSFSFVLLGGYEGAAVDSQKNFDVPP